MNSSQLVAVLSPKSALLPATPGQGVPLQKHLSPPQQQDDLGPHNSSVDTDDSSRSVLKLNAETVA